VTSAEATVATAGSSSRFGATVRLPNPRRDFYTHTFVLLAIAFYAQATGKQQALAVADETLALVDRHLRAGKGEGFLEGLPLSNVPRRQNPHMHMFEGLLSLWECSEDAHYLTRAGELFDLFAERFFRADPGILGEYFTAYLRPAEGVAGGIVEPGHHDEWVWLLRRFGQISGRSVQPCVNALYDFADRYGFDGAGLTVDELLIDGSHHAPSRRIWPNAEAVKANLVEARLGRPQSAVKAASLAVLLRDRFLTSDPRGGWHDRLDRNALVSASSCPPALCTTLSARSMNSASSRPVSPILRVDHRYERRLRSSLALPWSRCDTMGFWIGHQMFSVGSLHKRVNWPARSYSVLCL
jgi:mannose/cellobiose epimerase-like protein (N-acyl-D-glucosamine 2-epimerase family)